MKAAKFIRVITIAPLMASVCLTALVFDKIDIIDAKDYIFAILFLTVLPISAYPLQKILPAYKKSGREGQRNLAIVMAVAGYISGLGYAVVAKANQSLYIIYLTYLLSGIGIVFFNKAIKIKASGHACGVVGPISIGIYFLGIKALPSLIFVPVVFWASLKTGRHKLGELICGSLIAMTSVLLTVIIITTIA